MFPHCANKVNITKKQREREIRGCLYILCCKTVLLILAAATSAYFVLFSIFFGAMNVIYYVFGTAKLKNVFLYKNKMKYNNNKNKTETILDNDRRHHRRRMNCV